MKKIPVIIMLMAALAACHSSGDDDKPAQADRTVIIYMAAENDLSVHAWNNLEAIKGGSKSLTDNQCLLAYVDRSHSGEQPWLGRIQGGRVTDSISISKMGISNKDEYASDPHVFEDVLRYAVSHYPARQDYGLVLWGHSTGWLMEDSLLYTRGYGFDNGHNDRTTPTGIWLNIPTMNNILKKIPAHWSYLFADCCHFACLETAYELCGTVDYIIGSAAEMPSKGGPYAKIISDMFLPAETACKAIADKDYAHYNEAEPIVVIKTSEMAQLASATRTALQAVKDSIGDDYPNMTGIIHYLYTDNHVLWDYDPAYSIFYDAGDFIRHYTPTMVYTSWRMSLDRAVVYRLISTRWLTSMPWTTFYGDFKVTEENYHGVSMFVPQDPAKGHYATFNEDIRKMAWYTAAGLKDIGW